MNDGFLAMAGHFVFNAFDFVAILRFYNGLMEQRNNNRIQGSILYILFLFVFSVFIKSEMPYCNLVSLSIWSYLFLVRYKGARRNKITYAAMLLGCAGFSQMTMHLLINNQSFKAYIYFIPHFIFFILTEVVGRFQTIKGKSIDTQVLLLLVSVPVASLIAMPCLVLLDNHSVFLVRESRNIEIVVISIIVLYMNIIVFYLYDLISTSFKNRKQKDDYEKRIRLQEAYYELLSDNQNVVRRIKHDMHNHLLVLGELMQEGNYVEAKQHIDGLIDEHSRVKQIIKTGNEAIDAILNVKISVAEENGIEIKPSINIPASLPIPYQDCIKVFGNLLDNAINAQKSVNAENKCIELLMHYNMNALVFHISNPVFEDVNQDVVQMDEDAHGYGLEIVKTTVSNYNGYVTIDDSNDKFVVNLVMYMDV